MTNLPMLVAELDPTAGEVVIGALALVLVFAPGVAWGRLLAPGASGGRAVLVALTVGWLVSMLVALVLVMAHALSVPSFVGGSVAIGLAPLASHRTRRGRGWPRPDRRRVEAMTMGLGGLVVALALTLVPSLFEPDEGILPIGATTWYYGRLADLTAADGAFPSMMLDWGRQLAFHADYAPVTAHTAAIAQVLGGDIILAMEWYRLVAIVIAVAAASLLLGRWLGSWRGALASGLFVGTVFAYTKLVAYKPETVALGLALLTVWFLDRAIVERRASVAIAAGLAATTTYLAHAEVFLLLAAWAVGVGASRLVPMARATRRPRVSGRAVAIPVLVLAVAVVSSSVVNVVVAGESTVFGYVTERSGPIEVPADHLPSGWVLSGDPTWDFNVGAALPDEVGEPIPTAFTDPRLLPPGYLRLWPGVDLRDPVWVAATAFVVVMSALLAWFGPPRIRRFFVWWSIGSVALLVGSVLANELFELYVPRRLGPTRLFPYEVLLPVAAVFGIFAAMTPKARRPGRAGRSPARTTVSAVLPLVVVCGLLGSRLVAPERDNAGMTGLGFETLRSISAELPRDARILSNAYSDGAQTALTERASLLDGRAVYLGDSELLEDALTALLGARRYFGDPSAADARTFLEEMDVDYLLVATDPRIGGDIGGYRPFETDLASLAASPDLRLVRDVEGRIRLYEVIRPQTGAAVVAVRGGSW